MKKIILACAVALGVVASASAENYMSVYGGYNNTTFSKMYFYAGDNEKKLSAGNGFEVGYIYGLGLGEESPMAIEFGLGLGYQASTTKISGTYQGYDCDWQLKVSQFNIKVPVNFTYKFDISESFAIAPYAGINFRFNPLFEGEYKATILGESETEKDKEGYKKFQMGWQAGAKFYYKKIYLYAQYGTDFMPAFKVDGVKANTRNFGVGVGYKF